MTSWPATRYRLANRGAIKEGNWADVTIFDLASIDDRATYEHPTESPIGIEWVLVNGVVTIGKGRHTGAKAGKVLYGPARVHDLPLDSIWHHLYIIPYKSIEVLCARVVPARIFVHFPSSARM